MSYISYAEFEKKHNGNILELHSSIWKAITDYLNSIGLHSPECVQLDFTYTVKSEMTKLFEKAGLKFKIDIDEDGIWYIESGEYDQDAMDFVTIDGLVDCSSDYEYIDKITLLIQT